MLSPSSICCTCMFCSTLCISVLGLGFACWTATCSRDTQTAGRHAIRFTTHWVDQSLQTAIRNIVSLGAIEVSADKDKEFYIDKLQNVHGISLQVGSQHVNFGLPTIAALVFQHND